MNWNIFEGRWSQLKGDMRGQWAKLTDDDLESAGGKKDKLVGILQKRYGILKDEAERQLDNWIAKLR